MFLSVSLSGCLLRGFTRLCSAKTAVRIEVLIGNEVTVNSLEKNVENYAADMKLLLLN